jgi:D-alanyl-D-alanine dipeptidase
VTLPGMGETVLFTDPRIAAVAVSECGEPLVDLRELGMFRIDPRRADPDGRYAQLRTGVVDRLASAQTLLPRGFRLLIVEGLGPLDHHRCGAAVDLTLCRPDGDEYQLGTPVRPSVVDYPAPPDDPRWFEAPGVSTLDGVHRQVLGSALSAVGLVNYPPEWWHWSYGDQYWAFVVGRPAARYGPRLRVHPPGQPGWRRVLAPD